MPPPRKNKVTKEMVSGLKTSDKQMPSASGFGLVNTRARISRNADAEAATQEAKIAADPLKYGANSTGLFTNRRDEYLENQRKKRKRK